VVHDLVCQDQIVILAGGVVLLNEAPADEPERRYGPEWRDLTSSPAISASSGTHALLRLINRLSPHQQRQNVAAPLCCSMP
jgi:hypothetical protein